MAETIKKIHVEKVAPKEPESLPIRIKIAGNAMIITSSLKLDSIKRMEKYDPRALALHTYSRDEEIEIFRVSTAATASVGKFGIAFSEADKNGFATATVLFPEGVTDKKAFIRDNFTAALLMLCDVERQVQASCNNLDNTFKMLDKAIEEIK